MIGIRAFQPLRLTPFTLKTLFTFAGLIATFTVRMFCPSIA